MKKIILCLFLLFTTICFSQSIGIKNLLNFKNSNIGQIEEELALNNWILSDIDNVEKSMWNPFGAHKLYTFTKENYLNNVIATITVTIYEEIELNDITFSTKENEIYKNIILNLKKNGYKLIKSNDSPTSNFFPKINEEIVSKSFEKTYSDNRNEVSLYVNQHAIVTSVNSESYTFRETGIKYKLRL